MDIKIVANLLLPLLLIVIMFGLGLGLTYADFKRVAQVPKPVIVGLVVQMLLLPAVAFGLCHLAQLPAVFSIGLMLIAASPGAPTANIYSKLVGADVPLNISLTAINSLLTSLTLPLVAGFAIYYFADETKTLELPASQTVGIFLLVTVPVALGLVVNRFKPSVARMLEKPLRILSIIGLIVIVVGATAKEWNTLMTNLPQIGWVVVLFNILTLSIAYAVPRLFAVNARGCIAIMFGCGVHNGSIPLYVAISLLQSTAIAVPVGCYCILMYFTAGGLALWIRRRGLLPEPTG